MLQSRGHTVHLLPLLHQSMEHVSSGQSLWLGCSWEQDAEDTAAILQNIRPDWLLVDHYGIDTSWENAVSEWYFRLLVIDDLADRSHVCHVLLDQNLGRKPEDYEALLPEDSVILTGPDYALIRPEFPRLRRYSLSRRTFEAPPKTVLISMGGSDSDNMTGLVLDTVSRLNACADWFLTIVMGPLSPWVNKIEELLEKLNLNGQVLRNVTNMAQLMADADLTIGAPGSTSWERCCLGVPSVTIVLADNQKLIGRALAQAEAAVCVEEVNPEKLGEELQNTLERCATDIDFLALLSKNSSKICSGSGVEQVRSVMIEKML